MSEEDKENYKSSSIGSDSGDSSTEFSADDKKKVALRAAKRFQGDVSFLFFYYLVLFQKRLL